MEARSINLMKIFQGTISYRIPLFQRPYVWNEADNWEPLWDDIRMLSDRLLRHDDVHPHFLGAVVLDQMKGQLGTVEQRQVIDGQQRLTTLQLFLAAVRDLCAELDQPRFAARYRKLTENDESFVETEDDAFKLIPTNADQDAFAATLNAGSLSAVRDHFGVPQKGKLSGNRIPDAYLYFTGVLEAWLHEQDEEAGEDQPSVEDRLEALWRVIQDRLLLVAIDLGDDDDAQVIFETLNARGTQLLPADLVKNFLFHLAESENEPIEKLYESHWRAFDSDYWRDEITQGRLKRPRIDIFLQHYLALMTNDDVNVGHIFGVFKFFYQRGSGSEAKRQAGLTADASASVHLERLGQYARVFSHFSEKPFGSRPRIFFDRLVAIDTATVYPFLLDCFKELDGTPREPELHQILVWLESYLVRRLVCQYTAKNYNRFFLDLVRETEKAGGVSEAVVRNFLLRFDGESTRWPTDEEFREAWLNRRAYGRMNQTRVRMILSALDRALEAGKSEALELPAGLQIEHLMPQNWQEHWPLEVPEGEDEEEMRRQRDELLHSFGNLTLITGKLNPAISNSAWEHKRPEILKFSKLNLTRYFHDTPQWNEEVIRRRSEALLDKALAIWPHPGKAD